MENQSINGIVSAYRQAHAHNQTQKPLVEDTTSQREVDKTMKKYEKAVLSMIKDLTNQMLKNEVKDSHQPHAGSKEKNLHLGKVSLK